MKAKRVLLAGVLIPSFFAFAATVVSTGLEASGAILEVEVAPGEHIRHKMIVCIDDTEPSMGILVEVVGFGQSLDGGNVELDPELDTGPYSARGFLSVSPASFHLEPGGSQRVLLEGEVPADVGAGGRYALVYIHSLPTGGGPVGIALAIDVPVLLTISGTQLVKTGEIMSLNVSEPVSGEPLSVSVVFKNTGNYHFKVFSEGVLKDEGGAVLAHASTTLTSSSIIPSCSRLFELSLSPSSELQPGTYYVRSTVSLEDGTILDGKEARFEIAKPYTPPRPERPVPTGLIIGCTLLIGSFLVLMVWRKKVKKHRRFVGKLCSSLSPLKWPSDALPHPNHSVCE